MYPIGISTNYLWAGFPYFSLLIAGILLCFTGRESDCKGLNYYAYLYSFGTLFLIFTSILSGNYEYPFDVLQHMVQISILLLGLSRNIHNVHLFKTLERAMIASALIYIVLIFFLFGFEFFSFQGNGSFFDFDLESGADSKLLANPNAIAAIILPGIFTIGVKVLYDNNRVDFFLILALLTMIIIELFTFSTRSIFSMILILILIVVKIFNTTGMIKRSFLSGLFLLTAFGIITYFGDVLSPILELTKAKVLGYIGFEVQTNSDFVNIVANNGAEGRKDLIKGAFDIFKSNPILGIGLENTRIFLGTYSHFDFVELLASGGFFGPILFYFGYLIFLISMLIHSKKIKMSIVIPLIIFVSLISLGFAGGIYKQGSIHLIIVLIFHFMHKTRKINSSINRS
jgi:hypothetical protein